ncbi:hypothetical protein NDA01_28915 [Trichocoleus desertorum AS-A10]
MSDWWDNLYWKRSLRVQREPMPASLLQRVTDRAPATRNRWNPDSVVD